MSGLINTDDLYVTIDFNNYYKMKNVSFYYCLINIFLINTIFLFSLQIQAQDLSWVQAKSGTSWSNIESVATDNQGNSYSLGSFQGTQDFDPGSSTLNLTALGVTDLFVLKEDPQGNLLWVKRIGGANSVVIGFDIGIDAANNVFITGRFEGTADFNPGSSTYNLSAAGFEDAFLCKLSSTGSYVWAHRFGTSGSSAISHSLAVDDASNVYITGMLSDVIDFNPAAAINNLGTLGNSNAFLCKFSSSGSYTWGKYFGGNATVNGCSLALDSQNNVYTTGHFNGYANFDIGGGNSSIGTIQDQQIYVTKHSSTGVFQWVKQLAGYPFWWGENIAVDRSNNIYVAAPFSNSPDFNPGVGINTMTSYGGYDAAITKLDNVGNFLWAKQIGGPNGQFIQALHADSLNNIYFSGIFTDSLYVGDTQAQNTLYTNNLDDIFLGKLDSAGTNRWIRSYGGANFDHSKCISIDPFQNMYVVGYFNSTADFDPGPGVFEIIEPLSHASGFLQKINLCATVFENDSVTACGQYKWINGVTYFADPGPVTHTLTNAAGCDSVLTLVLNVQIVNADVSMPDDITIEAINNVADSYQWVDCDNGFSFVTGASAQQFLPISNGNYAVIVSENGCSDTSSCLSVSVIGLEEKTTHSVQLIPNPTSGSIQVCARANILAYEIVDIQGATVFSREVNDVNFTIDLQSLNPGFYFLCLQNYNGHEIHRIMKE